MKLQILHTNDLHNHFPGRLLEQLKEPNGILLDSGDALAGSNTVFRWNEPILQEMSRLGYHAMAMGNREFHYLRKVLRTRMKDARFPMLAANLSDLRQKLSVPEFSIFSRGPLSLGIFGLTVPQYPEGSPWEKILGWRFLDPFETAMRVVSRLQSSGVHLVFCLSHLGFPKDQEMARQVEGLHVIFGGHSHTLLREIHWENGAAILQGGAYGRFVGNWELEVELSGQVMRSWKLSGGLVSSSHD